MNRKNIVLVAVLSAVVALVGSRGANANLDAFDRNGTVPFPFATLNQFVELANDELYWLTGTVRQFAGQTFFEVDFESTPWLASRFRRANPMYRVVSATQLPTCYTPKDCRPIGKAYKDEYVTLLVRAHWVGCKQLSNGTVSVDVSITPLTTPQIEYNRR